tara:strand:- start:406 stop:639 length:234 start_codon:yes stop_codon:yes gene_type:complete
MQIIDTLNLDKFQDAIQQVGKGPCVKFDCDRQSECATEKVECKAFRFWVNNDSYTTMRKGKKTSIDIDMKRLLKEIE